MLKRLNRLDFAFLAAGAAGLLLFVVLLPLYHPDAAATRGVGSNEAMERAELFVEKSGFSAEDLRRSAFLSRSPELIDSLQARLGRRSAIIALKEGGREQLPAFYWEIDYIETVRGLENPDRRLNVRVLPDGRIWSFRVEAGVEPLRPVDLEALRLAFGPEVADLEPEQLAGTLATFDISEAIEAEDIFENRPTGADVARAVAEGRTMAPGPGTAAAIARAHLNRTAQGELPMVVSRVEPHPTRGPSAARVVFESEQRIFGQHLRTEVDVAVAGTLTGMRSTFNEVQEIRQAIGTLSIGPGNFGYREALKFGTYALLIIVLLVLAIRRLSSRTVDMRAALRDAFVVAFFSVLGVALSIPLLLSETGWQPALVFLFLAVGGTLNAFLFGTLAFVTSAGGDALARAWRPESLNTLSLARLGHWGNAPTGRALLRGLALGAGLVGLAVLLLALFADSPLAHSPGNRILESQRAYSVLLGAISTWVWYAVLVTHAMFLGLGALLARFSTRAVLPGLAIAFAVVGLDVVQLPAGPEYVTWIAALAIGLALAVAYVRTEALTMFVALMTAAALWSTREGLLVPGSPAIYEFGILLLLVGALGAHGMRSIVRSDNDEVPVYEPDFVVEQREWGRLQRELEIARDVQQSLLPRSLPEVSGLELAAACVPADEVGGDYYDLIPLPDGRLAVIIGDVSGKGIKAAFYMTLVKGYVRALACELMTPVEVLARLNTLFRATAPRGTFVSMIYGVMDSTACTIRYARAGHTPLVIKRAGGTAAASRPPGMAIGMVEEAMFVDTLSEETLELCPDDVLLLYTDGVSEAMNGRRDEFSDERVLDVVSRAPTLASAVLDSLMAEVQQHVGQAQQHDDLTAVVVRFGVPAQASHLSITTSRIADVTA